MRMAWVESMLREWAAWFENPSQMTSAWRNEVGGGKAAGNWLPRDTRLARRAHEAICRMPMEYAKTIVLVYIKGPRMCASTLDQIAFIEGMEEQTLLDQLDAAETVFAHTLDDMRRRRPAPVEKVE